MTESDEQKLAELTAILKVPAGLDAKVIAQGLIDELDAEKRAHGAHHQAENEAVAKLAELVAILGDDPVGLAKALVAENAALQAGEPEAVRYMRMQRDVFCEKLNDYIDRVKAAEKETARLQARVAELEHLHTFLREHGPDLMLYTKPQVEGLKRPCRDALGEIMKRMVKP